MLSMIEAILMNIPNPIKNLKSQNEKLNTELNEYKKKYDECFSEFERLMKEYDELLEENGDLLEKIETYEREGKFAVERYVEDIFDRLVEEIANNVRNMDESDISYPSFDFDDYI